MRRSIILPLALLALGGCLKPQSERAAVTAAEAARIAAQAEASFTTGDVTAIMRQYADSAVMIDAASPAPSADRKVQTLWARNFVSMQPADYSVPDRRIQLLGPDAFISSGTETFTVAAGAARPRVSARFSDVFQRQKDGAWKIVHEHVSVLPSPAPTAG